MITMDDSTLGGRIRAARISIGQKIRDFAPKVGVTANYLSLAERGIRNPSAVLVQRIAEATGKDFNWLMHGQQPDVPAKRMPSPQALPIESVNPRLFLTLILLYSNIPREQLASMLMIPPGTLDRVLDGEDTEFRANWETSFALLVRYLDIPAVRKNLEDLISYLKAAEQSKRPELLVGPVQEYLRKTLKWDCQLYGPVKNTVAEYDVEDLLVGPRAEHGGAVPCVFIPMNVKDRPTRLVHIRCFLDIVGEPDFFTAVAKQEARSIPDDGYLVVVFDKKSSYEDFVNGMCSYYDRKTMEADENPYSFSEFHLPMSILLVDGDTMAIKDEYRFE